MKKLKIETAKRTDIVDITDEIFAFVRSAGIKDGIMHVYTPHTTCGLTINENADPSVRADILRKLEEIVPFKNGYTHSEGNSDAHIKSVLMGQSLPVFVENGQLQLGIWQGIFLCEFDGPRIREVWLKIISSV
ncbi:MAG TPA: secondary thiamine-phosphate synthase enzyme YjbQ [bacterium]|nr:secondary thiamine-phosphate synthase enzyme YjbQ [bacterium]